MAKIASFYKQNLRNATHLQVLRNCVEYAQTLTGIGDSRFEAVKSQFVNALNREDDLFQISQGSKYTKQIEDADKARDRAYSIISAVSHSFADGYGPSELVEPAQLIQELIAKHKVKNDDQYVQQTGMVSEFVQHAQEIVQAFVTLRIDNVLATLRSANDEVNHFIMKRQTERAEVAVGALREARLASDAAYDLFVQYVEALSIISPSAAIDKFIKEWNSYINYVRVQILKVDSVAAYTPSEEDGPATDQAPSQDGGNSSQTPTPPSQGDDGSFGI